MTLEQLSKEVERQMALKKGEITSIPPGYVVLKGDELWSILESFHARDHLVRHIEEIINQDISIEMHMAKLYDNKSVMSIQLRKEKDGSILSAKRFLTDDSPAAKFARKETVISLNLLLMNAQLEGKT